MAESSPEGWVLSDEALQKVIKTVRRELGRPVNQRDDRGRAPGFSGRLVYPFINDSESTAPRGAVLGVTASLKISLNEDAVFSVVYRCTQANTTFRNHWGVNVGGPVAAGECGLCTFEGPVNIAYDSGTPAFGEGWGPKPGQWTLSKGYPATTLVDGIVDSTNKLLLGTLAPITQLFIKATTTITAGAVSSGNQYDILAGTLGSETDAGFTTVPNFYNPGVAFANNDKGWLSLGGSGWVGGKIC